MKNMIGLKALEEKPPEGGWKKSNRFSLTQA